MVARSEKPILWFKEISKEDIPLVGGKNASLGEMYRALTSKGVIVPNGFAVTASAYWQFLRTGGLDKKIKEAFKGLDVHNLKELRRVGKEVRTLILHSHLPKELAQQISAAYRELSQEAKEKNVAVAVRSSATAEDLPDASFAGQQETYLNIRGEADVIKAVQKCIASLYTDRAISYREGHGFDHLSVALSVTVQLMVDASSGASGVMFTLDTESGFSGVVLVSSSYGLGEYIVQGRVIPDQFYVFKETARQGKPAIISRTLGSKQVKLAYGKTSGTKQMSVSVSDRQTFSISEKEVLTLAKWAMEIEQHYGRPQDIEWAKDGKTGKIYIVQARPETVKSRAQNLVIERYHLKKEGEVLLRGIAVGQKIGAGKVRIIDTPKHATEFRKGDVLVTRITDPDWEPLMRKAAAIITEQGGKTSHAAIVSRELGVPCIVGATDARKILHNGQQVTVSCSNGDEGRIYKGILPFEVKQTEMKDIPQTKTKIMMNVGDPEHAFGLSFLPHDGIGLARLEFIFSNFIRIHPLALVHFDKLKDKKAKKKIREMTRGYEKKTDYCVEKLAEGIGRIAAAFYPNPVIVRLSDFKTNEYATLVGGKEFEPHEENPMLGWRGASRYYSEAYKPGFKLECDALKKVRNDWGLTNVVAMVPFCRTPEEGRKVLDTMKEFGLKQGENGLEVYVMCEIPSNVILADEFAEMFDGFSIGSNDLTQLTLGLDRDTTNMTSIGDVNNLAVKRLIQDVIKVAHTHKRKVGICGQAPSDYPEFAEFLVQLGIDSISLNPDTVVETRRRIATVEKTLGRTGRKTNKKYLSLVLAIGAMAATFMGVGAGCVGVTADIDSQASTTPEVTPAQIRERAVEKVTQMYREGRAEERVQLSVNTFANFRFSHPVGWQVSQWNGGVTAQDPQTGEYVSVYKELLSPPVPESAKQVVQVGGRTGWKTDLALGEKQTTLVEVIVDDETTVFIEGRGAAFESILASFGFFESTSTVDRPLTHWDIREKRACIQVITYARQGKDGQCQAYSTPCEVPDGWQVCDVSDVQ